MAAPHYQFYTKPEYYADLIARLAKLGPGDRFVTATMTYQPADPAVAPLHQAICAAAQRGVHVTVLADAYNYLMSGTFTPGPLFLHSQLPPHAYARPFQEFRNGLAELRAAGARCVITNQPGRPFTNPKAGRSHMKFTVIGDRFYVGGSNLELLSSLDFMVGADAAATANWLASLADRIVETGSARLAIGADLVRPSGDVTFLVDAGAPKRSIILERALEFIDHAQETVFISCQYFPYGITAQHLLQAHDRGVKVTIAYNHPSRFGFPANLLHHAVVATERRRLPAEFFVHSNPGPGYLHAKLIATEAGAMVGSHNYVPAGVQFGTAEIAMLVRDPGFARRAVHTVLQQLPAIRPPDWSA